MIPNMMKNGVSILLLIITVVRVNSLCDAPQKAIYLSFRSLANRDHIQNLFENISGQSSIFSMKYQNISSEQSYELKNIKYKLNYINQNQRESYLDSKSIRVSLGVVKLMLTLSYNITDKNNKTLYSGVGYAQSYLDPAFFEKTIIEKDGFVEWEPKSADRLPFTALWFLQKLVDLPLTQHDMIEKILNNIVPVTEIRADIEAQINSLYQSGLKIYLNSDKLFSIVAIPYKYRNISISLTHKTQNISVENASNGLVALISFGFSDAEQINCGTLPKSYNERDYGGVVQVFTINSLKFIILQGLNRGLFNMDLDRTWESEVFQLYMGDLANAVPYADLYDSNSSLRIQCFVQNISKAAIYVFDQSQVYLQTPELCLVKSNGENLLKIALDLIILARLTAESDYLSVRISKAYTRKMKFQPIHPRFKVERQEVAEMIVKSTLEKMIGSSTYGHGLPLLFRRFPALSLSNDYLTVFDSSEVFVNRNSSQFGKPISEYA